MTPAKRPELLEVWVQAVRRYQEEDGVSKWDACGRVGDEHHVSPWTVYDWVTPSRREHAGQLREYAHAKRDEVEAASRFREDVGAVVDYLFDGSTELGLGELSEQAALMAKDSAMWERMDRVLNYLGIERTGDSYHYRGRAATD